MSNEWSFVGVFKASKLSSMGNIFEINNASIIVNIQEGKLSGHFVALFLSESYCLYFDSLGKKKINYCLQHFLKKKYKIIIMNNLKLQSSESSNCAKFSVLFCKQVRNIKTYRKFLKTFHKKSLISNDWIIDLIFNKSLP